MWRAFVYDAKVDPDRVKRANLEFVPLDGKFRDNVLVQVKNGPLDFQPREPFHPLFGAMPRTPIMTELQITQEYLGQSTHLVYLAPMWKEFFDAETYAKGPGSPVARIADGTLEGHAQTGIAGVANTGRDHELVRPRLRPGQLVRLRPPGLESGAHRRGHRQRVDPDDLERRPRGRGGDTVDADGLARGLRRLHHAPGPPPPDRRRPLRAHAGEPRPAPRRLVGALLSPRRRRSASASTARPAAATPSSQYRSPLREQWADPAQTPREPAALVPPRALGLPVEVGPRASGRSWSSTTRAERTRHAGSSRAGPRSEARWTTSGTAAVLAKLQQQAADAAAWRDKCLRYFQTFSKRPLPASIGPGPAAPSAPVRAHARHGPPFGPGHGDRGRDRRGPRGARATSAPDPRIPPRRGRGRTHDGPGPRPRSARASSSSPRSASSCCSSSSAWRWTSRSSWARARRCCSRGSCSSRSAPRSAPPSLEGWASRSAAADSTPPTRASPWP